MYITAAALASEFTAAATLTELERQTTIRKGDPNTQSAKATIMSKIQHARIEHAQVLVIDIQERLLPKIHDHEAVLARAALAVKAAGMLGVPITVSEQYPDGLGRTPTPLLTAAEGRYERVEKMTFSVCGDEAAKERLRELMRRQVLIVGIETHVCVQQTVIDLLNAQYQPIILADAVGSRRPFDRDIALDRMRQLGATVTTAESAIFELLGRADSPQFKALLPHIK